MVEIKTGKKYKKNISAYGLASSSPFEEDIEVYNYLYSLLSQFVHPDILTAGRYVGDDGFNHLQDSSPGESILYVSFVNCLILKELTLFQNELDSYSNQDIAGYLSEVVPIMKKVFKKLVDGEALPAAFMSRLELLFSGK